MQTWNKLHLNKLHREMLSCENVIRPIFRFELRSGRFKDLIINLLQFLHYENIAYFVFFSFR